MCGGVCACVHIQCVHACMHMYMCVCRHAVVCVCVCMHVWGTGVRVYMHDISMDVQFMYALVHVCLFSS